MTLRRILDRRKHLSNNVNVLKQFRTTFLHITFPSSRIKKFPFKLSQVSCIEFKKFDEKISKNLQTLAINLHDNGLVKL